jgi:hypothetical protein
VLSNRCRRIHGRFHNVNQFATPLVFSLPLLLIGLTIASLFGVKAAAAAEFSELITEHAAIRYPPEKEHFARELGEAFEWGLKVVAEDLGYPSNRVTIYVYRTRQEMAEGATAILGRNRSEADGIARAGMSDRDRDSILVIGNADTWGDFLWLVIAHEHAHGMTTERFGSAIADSARWIFEGLGEYEGLRALEAKSPEAARAYQRGRQKVAFKALVTGHLPQLEEIADRETWFNNINTDTHKWDRQYACAYVTVDYVIRNYGFQKFSEILKETGAGVPYGAALMKVLGISPLGLEVRVVISLIVTGFFDLYLFYTAMLAAIALAMTVAAISAQRTGWRPSPPAR